MDMDSNRMHWVKWVGLALGPLLCLLCMVVLPEEFQSNALNSDALSTEFSWAGRATLGVMVWMGVWWLTEAIHISATALLPIVAFPLLGIAKIDQACFPYADPLVYMYFGGFVLALSMERWGLGKRIALITLNLIGTSAPRMIAGFMLVTAVLSAFVSNTATTAMMLPIALSVIALLADQLQSKEGQQTASNGDASSFATCLLLSIAYSASIGGAMTVIGTPTNTFLVGFIKKDIALEFRQDISFAGWLPIGVPFVLCFLPIMYLVMTRYLFPVRNMEIVGGKQLIERELRLLGRVKRGEWNTLAVFAVVVSAWLFRPLLNTIEFQTSSGTTLPFASLTDAGIAMTGALVLFLIPVSFAGREFTMDWATAEKMPWGILFLFGGGLSLAKAVQTTGVAEFIGSQTGAFGNLPTWMLILIVTSAIIFLTELTSNAATTASLVPVLAALAPGLGVHPYLLIVPATIAASCAFMLPVATPPNAIVFGSGKITIPQMLRAGFLLNLIAIVLVTVLALVVIKPWLGV
jgi:solute carrier family 13 (sodium-dependent dicarboxylate transporter), member 2/3/5